MTFERLNIRDKLHLARSSRRATNSAIKRNIEATVPALIGADLKVPGAHHAIKPGPVEPFIRVMHLANHRRHQGDRIRLASGQSFDPTEQLIPAQYLFHVSSSQEFDRFSRNLRAGTRCQRVIGRRLPIGNALALGSAPTLVRSIDMLMSATMDGDCLVIAVHEKRVDAAVAVRFKDQIREMTDAPSKRVVLNLAEVEFLDSSGLGAVVGAMKQLGGDRPMDLAGLTPGVDKVFRMTRMDTVFRIYPDLAAALRGVAHAS